MLSRGVDHGRERSGKTSGSGELLARKYLKAGFGGLVLCFKTDEADLWRLYLKHAGREADGRYFSVEKNFDSTSWTTKRGAAA